MCGFFRSRRKVVNSPLPVGHCTDHLRACRSVLASKTLALQSWHPDDLVGAPCAHAPGSSSRKSFAQLVGPQQAELQSAPGMLPTAPTATDRSRGWKPVLVFMRKHWHQDRLTLARTVARGCRASSDTCFDLRRFWLLQRHGPSERADHPLLTRFPAQLLRKLASMAGVAESATLPM